MNWFDWFKGTPQKRILSDEWYRSKSTADYEGKLIAEQKIEIGRLNGVVTKCEQTLAARDKEIEIAKIDLRESIARMESENEITEANRQGAWRRVAELVSIIESIQSTAFRAFDANEEDDEECDDGIEITDEWLQNHSISGTLNYAQMEVLGKKAWRKKLIGSVITKEQAQAFIDAREIRRPNK